MGFATFSLLVGLLVFPLGSNASKEPPESSASDTTAPCIAVLPEPDFKPSKQTLAMRERSINEGAREIDLSWHTPEEDMTRNQGMPRWMRKISKKVLDRILLLQWKGVLEPGRRHLAAAYTSESVPVDSLARINVSCKVRKPSLFDEQFFANFGGRLGLTVRDPTYPDSLGYLSAWVPPEHIRCLAEHADVVWVKDQGITNHDDWGPARPPAKR